MKALFYTIGLIILILLACKKTNEPVSEPEKEQTEFASIKDIDEISVIAFGSCNDEDNPQPLWNDIIDMNPDLWIWLGDNIYGDSEDMNVMRQKYNKQNQVSDYRTMRTEVPILGIWDDHDFGKNNAGKEFSKKSESRDLMFEFLDIDESNAAWTREGAYQSYSFGSIGKQVMIILLDSRYFRDEPFFNPEDRDYTPNLEGTILGDTQWAWLEKELTNSTADVHLIANGIQVLHEDHRFEKWNNFPNERKRLLDMLTNLEVKNPILLSGDRHISEVARIEWQGKSIPEITSSGLTHSYENVGDEPNRYRVSKLVSEKSFGVLKINWSQPIVIQTELRGDGNIIFDSVQLN